MPIYGFSTLLDIDKLTRCRTSAALAPGFSTLLDIDKLTLMMMIVVQAMVLVLCWILIMLL